MWAEQEKTKFEMVGICLGFIFMSLFCMHMVVKIQVLIQVCREFKWDFSLIQVLLAHRVVLLMFQKWFVKYFAFWLGV